MNKIIIIAVAILAIVLGMPYVTGRVTESITSQLASEMNSRGEEHGQLNFTEYDRGIRSTSAEVTWNVPAEYRALFAEPITYQCDGQHGILSFNYQCRAKNVPNYSEFVEQELGGFDPLTVGGEVSVFGAVTQRIDLNEFDITNEKGEEFRVAAGRFDITTDKTFKVFDLLGQFGGFSATGKDGGMQLQPVNLEGSFRVNEYQLGIGEIKARFDGITLESNSDGRVQIDDIRLLSDAEEEGENLRVGFSATVAAMSQTESEGDQPSKLDDLSLSLSLAGVKMAELAEITERLQALAQFDNQGALSDEEESSRNAQAIAMLPELEDLLTTGLTSSAEFSADHEGVPLTFNFDLELLKDLSLGDFILLSVQPQAFFSKLELELQNRIPADFIELSEAGAQAMVNSRFYRRDGEQYSTDLKVSEQGISLNGKNLSVEEFLALMSNQNQ